MFSAGHEFFACTEGSNSCLDFDTLEFSAVCAGEPAHRSSMYGQVTLQQMLCAQAKVNIACPTIMRGLCRSGRDLSVDSSRGVVVELANHR